MQKIAISMGDANSIAVEIIAKALSQETPLDFIPVIYGNLAIFQQWAKLLKSQPNYSDDYWKRFFAKLERKEILFAEIPANFKIAPAEDKACSGELSFNCFKEAIQDNLAGKVQALVTAPISKNAWSLANIAYCDHSTLLKELCLAKEASDYAMSFCCPIFWLSLVTDHLPLCKVASSLSCEKILAKLKIMQQFLINFTGENPKIAVCGLNPHAGENGILGEEEIKIIIPAIAQARELGMKIIGPLGADTIFHRATQKEFKAILAMYHDQGLVGLKSSHFTNSAQVTLGLKIIRTSVAHGTAYDLAGKGKANINSLVYAIEMAKNLLQTKTAD